MGGLVPGWFILLLLVAAPTVIVVALVVAWLRVRSRRPGTLQPVCGGCGYALAPNPAGLTVCPECGNDFLSVGILAPNMKLGRRGSPVVPLAIAWFVLVAAGMVPLHGWLMREFSRPVILTSVQRQSTGTGAIRGVTVKATREQMAGSKSPDRMEAEVTITGPDGKEVDFTVDGVTKTITDAPAASGLRGRPWDSQAIKSAAQAAGAETLDDEAADKVRSVVDDAANQSVYGGGPMFSSSSSSFGSFGSARDRLRKSGGYSENGSSSSMSSGTSMVIAIGPLRGGYWVTLMVCVGGLLLAVVGAWLIAAVTRPRGERPVKA